MPLLCLVLPSDTQRDDDTPGVSDTYRPGQDRSLSDTILEAIADCNGADISESDFTLYESVEPDALDDLFHSDAAPTLSVDFTVGNVRVRCRTYHGVEIRVTERSDRTMAYRR